MIKYIVIFILCSVILLACIKIEAQDSTKSKKKPSTTVKTYVVRVIIPSAFITMSLFLWDKISPGLPPWMGGEENENLLTGDYFDVERSI